MRNHSLQKYDDDDFDDDDHDHHHHAESDYYDGADTCPSCAAQIYDDADNCPHCGEYLYANHPQRRSLPIWVLVTAFILLLLTVISALMP